MRRFVLLAGVALLLSATMFSHNLLAVATVPCNGTDECTGTEVCLVTDPAQLQGTATCGPCTSDPNFNCITITVGWASIIHTAGCCDDLEFILNEYPFAFERPDSIPNIANCCVVQLNEVVIQLPQNVNCPPNL